MKESEIIMALKNTENRTRLSNGNSWLIWDDSTDEWVVYHHAYRARNSTEKYRGENERIAVKKLFED